MPPRLFSTHLLTKRWLPLLLCFNILLLVFFLLIDYQLIFHSDSAVKNLLAQEIVETGQYFPRDWNYTNGDLWVFYTQTFVVPLLLFMQNGYLAHFGSDLVSAALILYSSWLLTGLLEQGRLARLTGMLVVSGGMSLMMAEHIYGQAAYGSMYYMACFLLHAYWSLGQARGGQRVLWGAATAVLTLLVFWANPQRAALCYGLPLLAAGAVQQGLEWRAARDDRRRPSWRQLQALAVVLAAALAGIQLNGYTLLHVNNNLGLTQLSWLDFNGMARNLLGVLNGVVILFDGIPNASGKVASLAGAYAALRLVGALLLVFLLPWALYKALQPRSGPRQLVVVFAAISFAANLFMMVTTTLADMSSPDGSVRYLVPSLLFLLLILVGVMLERRAVAPLTRAAGIAAIALLATSAPASYLYPFNEFVQTHLPWRGVILLTPQQQLADFLQREGLRYGYATFWTAGKTSVLSDGAVRVRQVMMERGLPLPVRKLASNRWYTPDAWQGPSFLILRDDELKYLDQPLLASYAGQPRVLRQQDMTIFVYPANLAASLPTWDIDVRRPVHYRMDERTLHQRGALDHGVVSAQPGEDGNLHFGPMRTLGRGAYTVSFDIDAGEGGGAGDFGMVDVVTQAGAKLHARQAISAAGKQRVTLRFDTAAVLEQVEFRVFSSGRGRFALSGIDLERIPSPEKP
jgi:hypothetical protein